MESFRDPWTPIISMKSYTKHEEQYLWYQEPNLGMKTWHNNAKSFHNAKEYVFQHISRVLRHTFQTFLCIQHFKLSKLRIHNVFIQNRDLNFFGVFLITFSNSKYLKLSYYKLIYKRKKVNLRFYIV